MSVLERIDGATMKSSYLRFIMTSLLRIPLFLLLFCMPFLALSETFQVRIVGPQSPEDASQLYFEELIKRSLTHALGQDTEVAIVKIPYSEALHGGVARLLKEDVLDLSWSAADIEDDLVMLPVKIPLVMGLLGYRAAVTHEDNLAKLQNSDDLKALKACQVRFWPDVKILQSNNYTVIPTDKFEKTYELTHKKRCDYFPRAIYEGYSELASAQKRFPELTMFDDVILYYPYPLNMYTSKSNIRLNELLYVGLNKMVDSGELLQLIKESEITSHLFPLSQWKDKQIISLNNPFLPADTPLDDKRLWIDLTSRP